MRLNWNFPWIPRNNNDLESAYPSDSSYESESEWGARKEFWRMYKSEQFHIFNALPEDWYAEDVSRKELATKYPSGKFLALLTSVYYYVTQVISFLDRLMVNGMYKQGVKVTMTLHKSRSRELFIDASGRAGFNEPRVTKANQIKLEQVYSPEEIKQDSLGISTSLIQKVLDHFKFYPSVDALKNDQKKFLQGL